MEATAPQTFRCGLCKSDDHEITSRKCPTKLEANKKVRERRSKRNEIRREFPLPDQVPTSNRYAVLAPLEEDAAAAEPPATETITYSAAVKTPRAGRRRSSPVQESPAYDMEEEWEIDNTLATLQKEIQRLKQRRAILQRQRVNNRSTETQSATLPLPPVIQGSTSTTMSPQELLCFVAKQLQTLTSVLLANLHHL